MVIAISMQKLSPDYAGLADSYYLAALPYLEPTLKRMDLRALQCLVLIAQYSMLTPTRTAAYWIVGTAVKLCQDLGLTEEATITKSPCGQPLNPLEIDMRRRLFWIVISMEFGLSHSLGRSSCYSVTHDNIDVKFFKLVDDRYITAEGIIPGAKPVLSKCISIHFLKMRLLQLEARRVLYLNRRETPVDDQDPWFSQMLVKVGHWMDSCPKNDDGSGLNVKWYVYCPASVTASDNGLISLQVRRQAEYYTVSYLSAFTPNTRAVGQCGEEMLRRSSFQHRHAQRANSHGLCRPYMDLHSVSLYGSEHCSVDTLLS